MAFNISVDDKDKKIYLTYFPEQIGADAYLELIKSQESRRIYNTFLVTERDYYKTDLDDLFFVMGEEQGD